MLRLKKPPAAAATTAPAPASVAAESSTATTESVGVTGGETAPMEIGDESHAASPAEEEKISLVGGIGGVKVVAQKKGKRRTPGELRVQKDIAELDGGKAAVVTFPDPNNLTRFVVEITPDSGYWLGAKYNFSFVVPDAYPHQPPKVTCSPKIYHPNINYEGAVCLNILRDDWKPVLDINAVIYGLIYLFYEPNPDDPLNREAADLFRSDKAQFGRVVQRTLKGQSYDGQSFDKLT